MIVKAQPNETKAIYNLWKEMFSADDGGYTDYYFKQLYRPENTLVYKESGNIVSALCRNPHEILLNHRIVKTSMILGVATLPKYRRQGYMKMLMNSVLDECEHQELVTLIQAYNPEIYKPFGFEMVYYRKKYRLNRGSVPQCSTKGMTYEVPAAQLLDMYIEFVKRFDGYYARDIEYFENYKLEIQAEGGKIIGSYTAEGKIQGYAVLIPKGKTIEIQEIIYRNSAVLQKLVNVALKLQPEAIVHVSKAEQLEKAIPQAQSEEYGYTMARINDFELFNRLNNSHATSVKEAFALSEKPILIMESA